MLLIQPLLISIEYHLLAVQRLPILVKPIMLAVQPFLIVSESPCSPSSLSFFVEQLERPCFISSLSYLLNSQNTPAPYPAFPFY
jgi:hypothetical protein